MVVEILVGIPLLISASLIIIPILALSYLINNLSIHLIFIVITIFISSLFTIFLIDQSIIGRLTNIHYFISIIILTSVYMGLIKNGKE